MKKFYFFILFIQSLFLYSQADLFNSAFWRRTDSTVSSILPPLTVSEPAVWVRADSTPLNARQWRDVSGNGRCLLPKSGLLPNSFTRMNFNKSFLVERGEHFTLPDFPLQRKMITVMLVYHIEDTLSENSLWSMQLDTSTRIGLTTQRIICERGDIRYTDSNKVSPVVNTLRSTWIERYDKGDISIGRCDSLPFRGKIAECIVFDGKIKDTVFVQYLSYLSVKYGITLFETDYLNSSHTVIWDWRNNPQYSYSIGGIGKDLKMGLEQKQSYLLDEKITVGLSSLATTNEENRASMYQGDFLIWGFDNTLLNRHGSIYLEDGTELETYGNGLLQATGRGASRQSTFMQVDASQWANRGEDVSKYYLLIDRSGRGDFLSNDIEFYTPDFVDSTNRLYFSNIYWDTDNNGKDRFCFAKISFDSLFASKNFAVNNDNKAERRGVSHTPASHTPAGRGDFESRPQANQNSYQLFPNPNMGKFTVEIHYTDVSDITIKTFSPDGKVISTWKAQNQSSYYYEGTVSVKGQYMIDIEGGGERKSLKMIVQ